MGNAIRSLLAQPFGGFRLERLRILGLHQGLGVQSLRSLVVLGGLYFSLSFQPLEEQVVAGRGVVVLVRIKATDRVLFRETFLLEHVQDHVLIRNLVITDDESLVHAHWLVELEPIMSPDFSDLEPLLWICIQDLLHQVLSALAHEARDLELPAQDFLIKLARVRVLEGKEPADQGEHYHAAAPNIDIRTQVFLPRDHLRGRVARGPTGSF